MPLQIGEIFDLLYKAKKPAEKIEILKRNDSKTLRELLRLNFDKNIEFDLPEGDPPFRECKEPVAYSTLAMEWRKMYLFIKGKQNLKPIKRESLFIGLLESVSATEAKVLLEVKDRKLKVVTLKQVQAAFPDFPIK